jgi:hypothetical protein
MMQPWYVRAAVAAAIGLGVVAGLARGQPPVPGPNPEPWAVIEYGSRPAPPPVSTAPDEVVAGEMAAPAARRRPLLDWWHNRPSLAEKWQNHPWNCRATHFEATCGSWESECVFIFGSCRQFFGETCQRGPSLYPPRGSPGRCSHCP